MNWEFVKINKEGPTLGSQAQSYSFYGSKVYPSLDKKKACIYLTKDFYYFQWILKKIIFFWELPESLWLSTLEMDS